MAFLHGVEVIEVDTGIRPIQVVRSSVIGIVGTAPDADAAAFPLNEPVLIAGNRTEAAKLDTLGNGNGTLPGALDAVFDQIGATVVVIRVDEGVDTAATVSNVIGGVDATTGEYQGVQALLAAESKVGVQPRILIAPGFTSHVTRNATTQVIEGAPVVAELQGIADRLRAIVIADGPNTTDAEAIAYAGLFGHRRTYVVDPWVKFWDAAASAEALEGASARVAGIIAKSDNERGFWWSPSNREMAGIIGTARPVDFALGDPGARANLLNENNVAAIIQKDGYRLWGNRTTSSDPKWQFLSVVRTADVINDSLLQAHLWAVDRGITRTYVTDVVNGVNEFLRQLVTQGAIIGGRAFADAEANTPAAIASGQVSFDFEFTPTYPAERVTFRSRLTDEFLVEIV